MAGPFRSLGEAESQARSQDGKHSRFSCYRTEYGKAARHGHTIVRLVEEVPRG
jgi:hypothetical protein